jgi:hypothetical protein
VKARSPNWTSAEVAATVADYMAMLKAELAGTPYSKAEHRRRLMAKLENRSEPAVERKHMNISAVLRELGLPFIDGYKPLSNYQEILREVVIEVVAADRKLSALVELKLEATPPASGGGTRFDTFMFEDPPDPDGLAARYEAKGGRRAGLHFDYLEREAANRRLARVIHERTSASAIAA